MRILIVDDNAYSRIGLTSLLQAQMPNVRVMAWSCCQASLHFHQYQALPCDRLVFHLSPSSVSPLWRQLQFLRELRGCALSLPCTVVGPRADEGLGALLHLLMGPTQVIDSSLALGELSKRLCHPYQMRSLRVPVLTPRQRLLLDDVLRGYEIVRRAGQLGLSVKTLYHQRTDALKRLGFSSVHALRVSFTMGQGTVYEQPAVGLQR